MRHLLIEFGAGIRERLREAKTPRERLTAIVDGSFCDEQLRPEVISAWLTFYVQAHTEPAVRRLLHIYARRLISNLRHEYPAPADARVGRSRRRIHRRHDRRAVAAPRAR